eukprot:Rhum_TRINITY_DN12277_c0_g1::Rhum_TRINITY_DN12277_c0_g1_i1::g.50619::m.50619/K08850/AURKX; aurora kinase, other
MATSQLPQLPSELKYIPGHTPRKVTLADFEVGAGLGSGRYGTVNVARDLRTNALVALKRMNVPEIVKEGYAYQVQRELEIMQRLRHPNILQLYTYFAEGDHLYLVLEYAARGDLYNILLRNKGVFSLSMTAKLVAQLTEAIRYCHSQNVIHRDIKPENLLLDNEKNLKLADFGWSVMERQPKRATYCGTPDYIPPEMAENKTYGFEVDNWCIGVFCYESLYGKAPFTADDDIAMTKKILAQDYTFPEVSPPIPAEAQNLISSLLQKDPKRRISLDDVLNHPFITKYYKKPKEAKVAYP